MSAKKKFEKAAQACGKNKGLLRLLSAAISEGVNDAINKRNREEAEKKRQQIERQPYKRMLKLLENYHRLKASHKDCVIDIATMQEHPEIQFDIIDDMMRNTISRLDVKLEGREKARAKTHLALINMELAIADYRKECAESGEEIEKRRWRVLEAHFLNSPRKTTERIAREEFVDIRTVQRDLQEAAKALCVYVGGIEVLRAIEIIEEGT